MLSRINLSIFKFLSVFPAERRQLMTALAYTFLTGLCQCFLIIFPMALFLQYNDASQLPLIYFGVSVVTFLIGIIFPRIEYSIHFEKMMPLFLIFLMLPLISFWMLINYLNSNVSIFALLIWSMAVWSLSNLELRSVLNRLLTLQRAKTLFGLIGTVQSLGAVAAGFSTPFILKLIDVPSALIIAPVLLLACYLLLNKMIAWFPDRLKWSSSQLEEASAVKMTLRKALSSEYLKKLFLIVSFSICLYYILDLIFNTIVSQHYQNPELLAGFFGIIFAAANILAGITQAFFLRYLLEKRGLFYCLIIPPLVVGLIIGLAIGSYFISILSMFMLITFAKMIDVTIRGGVTDTAMLLLYQPLNPAVRIWAQAKVDTIVTFLTTAAVSFLLYLATLYGSESIIWLLLIYLVAASIMIMIIFATKKDYIAALSASIANRNAHHQQVVASDKLAIDLYKSHCRSQHPMEVIFCLRTLADMSPDYLDDVLPMLLSHSLVEVRMEAIAAIGKYQLTKYESTLEQLRQRETSAVLLAEMVTCLCLLRQHQDLSWCMGYLSDDRLSIREAAIAGMLMYGNKINIECAKQTLQEMIDSQHIPALLSAARLISRMQDPAYQGSLQPLLEHHDHAVRLKAIEAVGLIKSDAYFQILIDSLGDPKLRQAASRAIVRLNDLIMPYIAVNFSSYSTELKMVIAQLLGMMSRRGAIAILLSNMNTQDDRIMLSILSSLDKLLYQPTKEQEINVLEKELHLSLKNIEFLLSIYQQLPFRQSATDPLKEIIYGHIQTIWKKIFFALGCRYSHEIIRRITTAIMTANEDQKSYAQELLQVTLGKLHAQSILPLLVETLYKMNQEASQKVGEKGLIEILRRILNYPASSFLLIKMAAIYTIVQMRLGEFIEELRPLTYDENPLLRETAAWAIKQFSAA